MIKDKRFPWLMWIENLHLLITGGKAFYRSIDEIRRMVKTAGFVIAEDKPFRNRRGAALDCCRCTEVVAFIHKPVGWTLP